MHPIGIEFLSVFSLPPVQFIELAAELGCQHISSGLTSVPFNPHGYPPFSLREDAALRREMKAAMRDRNVSISLGEGFAVRKGSDVGSYAADLDLMYELGVTRINTVSLDPDRDRCFDQFGALAELAAERDMETTVELSPGLSVGDLDAAVAAIRHVGRADFRLLLDTMHVLRSGATPADIAALDPALIGYVQLCDAPLQPVIPDYMDEAMFHRRRPGEGELPLAGLLATLPPGLVVSLEIPMLAEAEAGVGPRERLGPAVETTRALLAGAAAHKP